MRTASRPEFKTLAEAWKHAEAINDDLQFLFHWPATNRWLPCWVIPQGRIDHGVEIYGLWHLLYCASGAVRTDLCVTYLKPCVPASLPILDVLKRHHSRMVERCITPPDAPPHKSRPGVN